MAQNRRITRQPLIAIAGPMPDQVNLGSTSKPRSSCPVSGLRSGTAPTTPEDVNRIVTERSAQPSAALTPRSDSREWLSSTIWAAISGKLDGLICLRPRPSSRSTLESRTEQSDILTTPPVRTASRGRGIEPRMAEARRRPDDLTATGIPTIGCRRAPPQRNPQRSPGRDTRAVTVSASIGAYSQTLVRRLP